MLTCTVLACIDRAVSTNGDARRREGKGSFTTLFYLTQGGTYAKYVFIEKCMQRFLTIYAIVTTGQRYGKLTTL